MTIYKLSDEILYNYKNKYGENLCGANVLDLLGFPKSTIEKLLKYRGKDFEWDDMLNVINDHDSKIKNKVWLIEKEKTNKIVLDYDKRDERKNKFNLQFITDELQNGTYKIIGIATDTWGHYMIIGKNNNGDVLTFDPQSQTLITGFDDIINDFNEDNIEYIISYSNGIVLDVMKQIVCGNKKKKSKRKKSKRKKSKRKKSKRKKSKRKKSK
jgi:hypothetical protein